MKVRITDEHNYGDKKVVMFHTEAPNYEGQLALELLNRFGLIAGAPDGEDSGGRQKSKLLPVDETVARCFELAREAMRMLRERGLMVALPDLNIINAKKDAESTAKEDANKAKATA